MTVPADIIRACTIAGHDPDSPAGEYFVGMALVARSMDAFRAELEAKRTAEPGNDILTIKQTAEQYQVSIDWIRTRINRKHHQPIPLHINDGVQRIRRRDFETWLHQEHAHAAPKNNKPEQKTPILRVEYTNRS